MARGAALVALVALAACGDNGAPVDRCVAHVAVSALELPARKLVGEASPYPADPLLRARASELEGSQRARRAAAWQAVARALAPVPLAVAAPAPGVDTLPRWRTWYGKDDLVRVFEQVFRAMPASDRHARAPLPDAALDAAFAWNPTAVDAAWTADRWQAYLDAITDQEAIDGAGGIGRVAYAPAAARTLLASYAQELACEATGAPSAFVDGAPAQPTTTREPIALDTCEARTFGPYFVASGETLTARGDVGGARAAITIRRDAIDGAIACDAIGACTIDGPGAVWVTIASAGEPIAGALAIDTVAPDAPWAGCLAARFPVDAALVKADWRRVGLGFQVPVHATDAAALRARLAGVADWGAGEGDADPGPDAIYTIRDAYQDRYRLSALHLMTRELDHWLWVTLWWSPDPDTDFGADRPPEIAALGGPWSHYKMCTSVAFTERDPDPRGGFAGDHPDLAAALAAVTRPDGPSWCSNPYLELGHGDATTNCIGCHQHGGTALTPAQILAGPPAFPASGRTQLRDNFPADYSWQTSQGDGLAAALRAEVEYWDSVP